MTVLVVVVVVVAVAVAVAVADVRPGCRCRAVGPTYSLGVV